MASRRSWEMNLGTYPSGTKTGFLVGDAFYASSMDDKIWFYSISHDFPMFGIRLPGDGRRRHSEVKS